MCELGSAGLKCIEQAVYESVNMLLDLVIHGVGLSDDFFYNCNLTLLDEETFLLLVDVLAGIKVVRLEAFLRMLF